MVVLAFFITPYIGDVSIIECIGEVYTEISFLANFQLIPFMPSK